MGSPKPEPYHDALYHLAAAAESSPSPQPSHYPDQQHYPPYQHPHHQHHDSAPYHLQGRHYLNTPPAHRPPHPQDQYRYADHGYSPSSASTSSTSSAPHNTDTSVSRLPPNSAPPAHYDHRPTMRSLPSHASDQTEDDSHSRSRPSDSAIKNAAPTSSSSSSSAAAAAAADKKISCMECRLSKVKCSGGDLCTRCKRLGKECYYKSHKRGRKSDSSKIQKLERTVDSLSRALEQFSRNKSAPSPGSSQTRSRPFATDTKRNGCAQQLDDQDHSSPDAFWKNTEAPSRPPAAPSSSAMSPPSHAPRAPTSAAHRDSANPGSTRPSELHRQPSASSTWQTPHSFASATPTSDDPDEPENLGLPTLSNPLKLLAHASDSARDRDSGPEASDPTSNVADSKASGNTARSDSRDSARRGAQIGADASGAADSSGVHPATPTGAKGDTADSNGRASLFGEYHGLTKTNTVSRFGPGRGKAFFDVGLFTTKLDNLPQFDPIDRGYLTHAEAENLYSVFMDHINPTITLLDPHLHTFDYVRSCSSLLLSCTCWIAAKYKVEASQIAADLEMHIRSNLLPTILMEGFRNAEIPQALIILAAYHPQMNTLSEDKAWAYVGFAIRIASELDMNSRIAVRPASRQDDAGLARRLRNRERTWLNLWLFETSMSQHMGRRPTLANDPVVMGCAHWHLDKFALPQDKAVVAVVQLRLLMKRNTEMFENFVDASSSHLPAERTAKQVELFRRICASDLDTWLATWTGPWQQRSAHAGQASEAGAEATSAERSKSKTGSSADLPPTLSRISRLKLYYWYARLILDTIALKSSHLGLEVLRPIYRDAYACCMAYLGLFVATMVPNGLFWGHNSAVVTPAYCAIFALKIVGLISTAPGGSARQQEEDLGIDVDAEYTFEMVERLAKACEDAGNATPHRRAAAGSYAFFLFTVLAKARSAWRAKLARREEREGAAKGRKREREGAAGGRQGKRGKMKEVQRIGERNGAQSADGGAVQRDAGQASAVGQGASSAALSAQGDLAAVTNADSDQYFLRQLMQFQAGPSGVQTAIVHDSLANQQPTPFSQQQTFSGFAPASTSTTVPMPEINVAAPNGLGVGGGVVGGEAGVGAEGGVDIDWDFGMLDGFLGESLFSDMSFVSASATPANMNVLNDG